MHAVSIYITFLVLILITWPMLPDILKLCISVFFCYQEAVCMVMLWNHKNILLLHQTHVTSFLPPIGHQLMIFVPYSVYTMVVKWQFSSWALFPTLINCYSIFFCVARASSYFIFLFYSSVETCGCIFINDLEFFSTFIFLV